MEHWNSYMITKLSTPESDQIAVNNNMMGLTAGWVNHYKARLWLNH